MLEFYGVIPDRACSTHRSIIYFLLKISYVGRLGIFIFCFTKVSAGQSNPIYVQESVTNLCSL